MIELVKVRLRDGGKVKEMDCNGLQIKQGERVIVRSDEGLCIGTVVSRPQQIDEDYVKVQVRKIVRKATIQDEDQCLSNRDLEKRGFEICIDKIEKLKLPMKLVDVEYLFEGQKAIFYFTAEGRVDFRQLVKELATDCRVRIEMRQIGVRDEAKMIGGFGICGRELCCASFLNEFEPISIRMAKDQDLPLAPGKVSGVCGRLMCCLSYENRTYEEFKAGLPRIGERVRLRDGTGRVRKYNIFENSFTVELESGEYMKVNKEDWHRGRKPGAASPDKSGGQQARSGGQRGRGGGQQGRGGGQQGRGGGQQGRGGAGQRGRGGAGTEGREGAGAPNGSGAEARKGSGAEARKGSGAEARKGSGAEARKGSGAGGRKGSGAGGREGGGSGGRGRRRSGGGEGRGRRPKRLDKK